MGLASKELMTIKEAAKEMKVSIRTVRRWLASDLPAIRHGRTVRIDPEDLLRKRGGDGADQRTRP